MNREGEEVFRTTIATHIDTVRQLSEKTEVLAAIARVMLSSLRSGGKILFCGNGGSAADSQHLAAELVGRFRRERVGLPSIALTTDTSILTAVANDYGYDSVFSRQVEALARAGDVLVGISTSGNSPNVVAALERGRGIGVSTVAFTGRGGGKMAHLADHLLAIDASETARVQETHILAGHMLCDWVDLHWAYEENPKVGNQISA
ncbi:D-sedoheptulose-7-phosphate isomerase [Occallatibacter savannae]|uniref:D-sedoheptulose-7-phosphate isomerase n=1 Tax=Occallatibacter savannae TaxID=1002691 RepID=UPI000D68EB51|nr:D-sedoheptulose 7-phosphate isomerase [Occallatibacter savannae]